MNALPCKNCPVRTFSNQAYACAELWLLPLLLLRLPALSGGSSAGGDGAASPCTLLL